ncbi:hypothetical protein Taro_053813 [Colocasia esculenta]|uniref:Uncharacterized protein n=1 Tax=Colocasia esculenta TaxID=4460 RepID=A0A843XP79_COLES|nr:hypothetical protein [Colocasia esculenta]
MDEMYGYLPLNKSSEGSKRLMKLSLGSPKKPPKHHSFGFLVDLHSKSPDELQIAGSKHANFRFPSVQS